MKINLEFKNIIPPLLKEEYNRLEKSIKEEGCRDPLIVWNEFIVDGHNRYEICKRNRIPFKTKERKFKTKEQALLWIINNQLGRRNIGNYDRVKLALKYEEILKPQAKQNLRLGEGRGRKGFQISEKVNTQKEIGKIAKVSHDTVSKVKFIEQFSNKDQKERLTKQLDSINKVYQQTRKKVIINSNGDKQIKMPTSYFDIIYADPPWRYQFSQTTERSIETKYNTLTLEQIKALKIPAHKNSILFLWATAPKLREALEVMEAWGFEYKTNAVWDKMIIGMGYWFRGQHELLLVGVKGKVKTPRESDRVASVFHIKRKEHSKKPDYFYELIEKLFPHSTYIELFARTKRKNWKSWGNEL